MPINETPSAELERELLHLAFHSPTNPRVRNITHILRTERGERPNALLYEALILLNSSEQGSASELRSLLQEMEQLGISMNMNICNAILRALVVHPDVDILHQVTQDCAKMWIEIDAEMKHLICAIYLRAGMPEIALSHLEEIEFGSAEVSVRTSRSGLQSGKAELWLYICFIQQLVSHGDWEGVMRMCYRLCDDTSSGIPLASRQMDVPYQFWHWLLEQAAAARDKWVTFWIWNTWVLNAWVKPSVETCMQVLEICADEGAVDLAQSASMLLRFLSEEKANQSQDARLSQDESVDRLSTSIRALLARAHTNAPPHEPQQTELEIRQTMSAWWVFDINDRIGLNARGEERIRSLRLDPWSTLSELTDPGGSSWSRVLSERQAKQDEYDTRENLRRLNDKRAAVEAGYATMVQRLPREMLRDIIRTANTEAPVVPDEEHASGVSGHGHGHRPAAAKMTRTHFPPRFRKVFLLNPLWPVAGTRRKRLRRKRSVRHWNVAGRDGGDEGHEGDLGNEEMSSEGDEEMPREVGQLTSASEQEFVPWTSNEQPRGHLK